MHSYSIHWDQLKFVLAIARTGNLSSAAKLLNVNQTTVGRNLNSLEQQLGEKLFYRSKNSMEPTEYGNTVIAEAEVMEDSVQNALERITTAKSDPKGLVRIVTMPWICSYVVTPKLISFASKYPNIEVQAIGDLRERFLDRGEVDIALRFEMRPRGVVQSIPVAKVPYSVYTHKDAMGTKQKWLGFREDYTNVIPEQWVRHRSDNQSVRFWANDAGILYHAVRSGMGKALLPDFLAENDTTLIRISGPEQQRVLHVQVLEDMRRLKRITVFLEWLTQSLTATFGKL